MTHVDAVYMSVGVYVRRPSLTSRHGQCTRRAVLTAQAAVSDWTCSAAGVAKTVSMVTGRCLSLFTRLSDRCRAHASAQTVVSHASVISLLAISRARSIV